jgi:hypothetical protein
MVKTDPLTQLTGLLESSEQKESKARQTGRAWKPDELRLKSNEDLSKLW